MKDSYYDMIDRDELPDEYDLEDPEFDLEIPDVPWKDDLLEIENHMLREREIEAAERWIEKEEELNHAWKTGELTPSELAYERARHKHDQRKNSTRAGLASVGMTYDHFGDLGEDLEFLLSGDDHIDTLKKEVADTVEHLGPDRAQELADKMRTEGRLSKKAHDTITRQVRLHGLK